MTLAKILSEKSAKLCRNTVSCLYCRRVWGVRICWGGAIFFLAGTDRLCPIGSAAGRYAEKMMTEQGPGYLNGGLLPFSLNPGDNLLDQRQFILGTDTDQGCPLIDTVARLEID